MVEKLFDVDIRELEAPIIKPSIVINMDLKFSGRWVVGGDLNGNGEFEFVSCRNDDQAVTAISAYSQDGKLLWTWGVANSGSPLLAYDIPLQLYDINNDGKCDVFFSKKNEFIVLDGITGIEKQKFPLPKGLETADSITFANLSGNSTVRMSSDIIIKSRYRNLWAYTKNWELLWKWTPLWNKKTCHHPILMDLDNNGMNDIIAGHKILNNIGKSICKLKHIVVGIIYLS